MFKIEKIKNYRKLAEALEKETGNSIEIVVIEKDHYHYQIYDKYKVILGTLCVDHGSVSFAPFTSSNDAVNSQYIDIMRMIQAEDLISLLGVFSKIFVEGDGEDV